MPDAPSVWQLPAAAAFLADLETAAASGGALVELDPSTPSELRSRLDLLFRNHFTVHNVDVGAPDLPLAALASAVGRACKFEELIAARDQILIADCRALKPSQQAPWGTFWKRFVRDRRPRSDGIIIFLLTDCGDGLEDPKAISWKGRWQRVDTLVWAEYMAPAARSKLVRDLAVSVAVELCGWRLDLIEDLVSQRLEDILEPRGWLARNADLRCSSIANYAGSVFLCPLQLYAMSDYAELDRRIWRAQLSVIFPALEEERLVIVDKYMKFLYTDRYLAEIGMSSIDGMEFGALRHQLINRMTRAEADRLDALASLRNALAHRRPIKPDDFIRCFGGRY